MNNQQDTNHFDPLFEFARLKFEISYRMDKLLTVPGEIGSFEYRMQQLEKTLLEWKKRADRIASALGN